MYYCQNCGMRTKADDKVCLRCGAVLDGKPRCKFCGRELTDLDVCSACGLRQSSPAKKTASKRNYIIGFIVVVCSVVLFASIVLNKGIQQGNSQPPVATTTAIPSFVSTFRQSLTPLQTEKEYVFSDGSFGGVFREYVPRETSKIDTKYGLISTLSMLTNGTQGISRESIVHDASYSGQLPEASQLPTYLATYVNQTIQNFEKDLNDGKPAVIKRDSMTINGKGEIKLPGISIHLASEKSSYEVYAWVFAYSYDPLVIYTVVFENKIKEINAREAEDFFTSCFFERPVQGKE